VEIMIGRTHFSDALFALLAIAFAAGPAWAQARGVAPPPAPFRSVTPPALPLQPLVRQRGFPTAANRFPVYGYGGGYFPYASPFYSAYDYGAAYYGYGLAPPPSDPGVDYNVPPPTRNFAPLPPAPIANPTTALLNLRVPAGAEIWLQGKKYDVGPNHTFESPDLAPSEIFTFDVRVVWIENGKRVEEKRSLEMKAGEFKSLMFLATGATSTKVEKAMPLLDK
jgi:uncharacterized protein (TIGR03000 family)